MAQTADQSLHHTISIRHLISFRTKMSATERGDENHASDNTAISLHRAEPKEVEGNVRPVSLVQEIFSDPAALNVLRQHEASHEDGVRGQPKALSSVGKSDPTGAFRVHSAVGNDTATYTPATKRPRGAENYSDEVVILEPDGTNLELLIPRERMTKTMNFAIALAGEQVNSYRHSWAHYISHCLPLREKQSLGRIHVQMLIVFTLPLWITTCHHSCLA